MLANASSSARCVCEVNVLWKCTNFRMALRTLSIGKCSLFGNVNVCTSLCLLVVHNPSTYNLLYQMRKFLFVLSILYLY